MSTRTYTAEMAREQYPQIWVVRKQALDICARLGFTESTWKLVKPHIRANDLNGSLKRNVRFHRDDLLRALDAEES